MAKQINTFLPCVDSDAIARNAQSAAILARRDAENSPETKQTLFDHAMKAKLIDSVACAYLANVPHDFVAIYQSRAFDTKGNAMFNEKAIPKVWEAAKVANGGSYALGTIPGFTLHCLTTAIAEGKRENADLQSVMFRLSREKNGKGYTNGTLSTQVSSSLRAMRALRVIDDKRNPLPLFSQFMRASGIAMPDMGDDASEAQNASSAKFDGVTIDGVCHDMPLDTLALSHSASPLSPHDDAALDAEIDAALALHDASAASVPHAAMLAITYDGSASLPKTKRSTRKSK